MRALGIMQGRLLPPLDGRIQAFPAARWRDEFPRASEAGLQTIEWIYETYAASQNPIGSDAGLDELRSLSEEHGVAVRSICADYFMEEPLVRAGAADLDRRLAHLRWLLTRCTFAGIERMVLPFVDNSAVSTAVERDGLAAVLNEIVPEAADAGVELHLEMSLAPGDFAAFLDRVPHAAIKVNYDSGNSASLGFDPREEFAAYGARIGSVHVKDRVRGGTTVPLGEGDADLPAVYAGLQRLGYGGDVILQVARGREGDEVAWARHNRELVAAALA